MKEYIAFGNYLCFRLFPCLSNKLTKLLMIIVVMLMEQLINMKQPECDPSPVITMLIIIIIIMVIFKCYFSGELIALS